MDLPQDLQEFTGAHASCAPQTSHHDPSVELSMFVGEEAQQLMRHPTKHSGVPKPSQAAGCARSHVAASSLASSVRSSIEALATIE